MSEDYTSGSIRPYISNECKAYTVRKKPTSDNFNIFLTGEELMDQLNGKNKKRKKSDGIL